MKLSDTNKRALIYCFDKLFGNRWRFNGKTFTFIILTIGFIDLLFLFGIAYLLADLFGCSFLEVLKAGGILWLAAMITKAIGYLILTINTHLVSKGY